MDHSVPHTVSTSWSVPATVAIVAALLLHALGWRRLREASPERASNGRRAAFSIGMIALWTAVGSPLSTVDHALLTFHMAQHLVLMTVAAPLILMGRPGVALSYAVSPAARAASRRLLRAAAMRQIARALTHPVSCWLAGTAVVLAWHVPVLHELTMSSRGWHALQGASFLLGGVLFWWPVVRSGRSSGGLACGHAVVYLFLATVPCDALSAFLAFCGRVVYPSHASGQALFGLSPLHDQECAGALMWAWVTFAYLVPAMLITLRTLAPSGARDLAGHAPAAQVIS